MLFSLIALYLVSMAYVLHLLGQTARRPAPAAGEPPFFVLVVPALNEELVIANTIRHLLSLDGENYMVLVIDDGSTDGTAAAVDAFSTPKVRLVSRKPPYARLGKGAALNYAYQALLTSEVPELYGESNVVMAVM